VVVAEHAALPPTLQFLLITALLLLGLLLGRSLVISTISAT
jgi:hypothetical protein